MADCTEFEEFAKSRNSDDVVAMLDSISDACYLYHKGKSIDGITITGHHTHNASNLTYTGFVTVDGAEYEFVMDSGDNDGTVMRSWGTDLKTYAPPAPMKFMFVPVNNDLQRENPIAYKQYKNWTKEEWFISKLNAYHYDRHFQPGWQTEKHYREWANERGLKIESVEVSS